MSDIPKPSSRLVRRRSRDLHPVRDAVPVTCIVVMVTSLGGGQRFRVPGRAAVSCPSPGTYVLWNETSTFFEGRSYSPGESLPDGMAVTITMRRMAGCFRSTPDQSTSEQSGGDSRRSIGTFEVARAGSVAIGLKGKFPDRIFFVRKSVIGRVFASIAGMIVSGAAGFLGASSSRSRSSSAGAAPDSCKIRDGPRKQPAVESRYENGEPTRVSPGGAACAGLRSGGPRPCGLAGRRSKKTPVSPFVYGHNHPQWEKFGWTPTISRAGGNRLTAYNWETNASNAGSDWQHQNDNLMAPTCPARAIRKGVASSSPRLGNFFSIHSDKLVLVEPAVGRVRRIGKRPVLLRERTGKRLLR